MDTFFHWTFVQFIQVWGYCSWAAAWSTYLWVAHNLLWRRNIFSSLLNSNPLSYWLSCLFSLETSVQHPHNWFRNISNGTVRSRARKHVRQNNGKGQSNTCVLRPKHTCMKPYSWETAGSRPKCISQNHGKTHTNTYIQIVEASCGLSACILLSRRMWRLPIYFFQMLPF